MKKGFYIEYKLTAAPNAVLTMNIDSISKEGAKQKFYKHVGGSKNAQILHINQHGEIDAREEEAIRAEADRIAAEAEVQEAMQAEAHTQPEQPQQAPEVSPSIEEALEALKQVRVFSDFKRWYEQYRKHFRLFRKMDGEAVDSVHEYTFDGTVAVLRLVSGKKSMPFVRVIWRYFELIQM